MRMGWLRVCVALGFAATVRANYDIDLYMQAMPYTWEETDEDGARLLKESGSLFGFGIQAEAPTNGTFGLFGRAEVFGGSVNYDGSLQEFKDGEVTLTPYESSTDYAGMRGELQGILRVPLSGSVTLRSFAGGGGRWWVRRLDSGGEFGYDEFWSVYYGTLGGGLVMRPTAGTRLHAAIGAHVPVLVRNTVDMDGEVVTLEPGLKIGPFAEAGLGIHSLFISVVWEQWEFPASGRVNVGDYDLLQPDSTSTLVSLNAGLRF